MNAAEMSKIYLQLELEISCLAQSTIFLHRNALKEDIRGVIGELKPEIEIWISGLNERKISCYELESLLESKRDSVHLARMEAKNVNREKLNEMKGDVLRLIARAIMNTYLNSLFRQSSVSRNDEMKRTNWF